MEDRVHRCLDEELPRSVLTSHEEAELDAFREAIDATRAFVLEPRFPDLTAQVMRSLPAAPAASRSRHGAARVRSILEWVWTPHTISLRPAFAFAGVAALALALALFSVPGMERSGASAAAGSGAGAAGNTVYVQFRLDAPDAAQVALAGSFSGWKPEHDLEEVKPGVWKTTVPMKPGVHEYLFVVDGERWVVDPAAIEAEDGFGGTNSRLYLAPGTART